MEDPTSVYNADELVAPDWLNEQLLLKVLTKLEASPKIKVNAFTTSPATSKSDHYASIMFRIKVDYTVGSDSGHGITKHKSMILKTMPIAEGAKKDLLGPMSLFETEISMYTTTLPKIEAVLRAHGDNTQLAARILYHSLESPQMIVFEDLCERGYAAISGRYCTMEEVKTALLKVAKLHAVSYKLGLEGNPDVTSHLKGSFNSAKVADIDMIKNSVKLFIDIISQYEDLRVYIPQLEKLDKNILDNCIAIFNAYGNGKRSGIQVLNHGDFHMKNMMIRSKDGALQDLTLVDYQLSIFGSCALDFLYSTVMLWSPEMRLNHREQLQQFYFENFQQTLKLLQFKGHIPTASEFQAELWEHREWELLIFISFLIINYIFLDPKGDIQLIVEDESYRRKIFAFPEVVKEIRHMLPIFAKKGYFDE